MLLIPGDPRYNNIDSIMNGRTVSDLSILDNRQLIQHARNLGYRNIGSLRAYIEETVISELVRDYGATSD